MFYAVKIKYNQDDSKVHFLVGLVYADGLQAAMKKANVLYSSYAITSIELYSLPDEYMEKIKSAYGGATIADFGEYIE